MLKFNTYNAFDLPRVLFPDTDYDTALGRFYEAQNDIAIAVSEYRFTHNLTQTELAAKLGVTQAMVSKYESGSYNISLKAAYELFDQRGMRFVCQIEDEQTNSNTITFDADEPFAHLETEDECTLPIQSADEPLIA